MPNPKEAKEVKAIAQADVILFKRALGRHSLTSKQKPVHTFCTSFITKRKHSRLQARLPTPAYNYMNEKFKNV